MKRRTVRRTLSGKRLYWRLERDKVSGLSTFLLYTDRARRNLVGMVHPDAVFDKDGNRFAEWA